MPQGVEESQEHPHVSRIPMPYEKKVKGSAWAVKPASLSPAVVLIYQSLQNESAATEALKVGSFLWP